MGKTDNIGSDSGLILTEGTKARRELELQETQNKEKQAQIDAYNGEILKGSPTDVARFANRKYLNNTMIVKLLKHDWIDKNAENTIFGSAAVKKIHKIYIETPQMGKESMMIDNPLPYRFEGVIVAMDTEIPTNDPHFAGLTVGSFIRVKGFDLKENRYYFDEGKREWIDFQDMTSLGSNMFPNYEGFATIHPSLIENTFLESSELDYV